MSFFGACTTRKFKNHFTPSLLQQLHLRWDQVPFRVETNYFPFFKRVFFRESGVIKVTYNLIIFPKILIFFLKISVLFPTLYSSQQPQYYWEDDPASHISHAIFFPTATIFSPPLHNLIFFPNRLDKLPGKIIGRISGGRISGQISIRFNPNPDHNHVLVDTIFWLILF